MYWWYNQEDNCIGAPIVTHRALLWGTWQADLAGYFVWSINNWGNKGMDWATVFEIGEAMALYPGKDGRVDSLRWEQTREGLEDYEYLRQLESIVDDDKTHDGLRKRGRDLLGEARKLLPDPRCQVAADPSVILSLRNRIGHVLHDASGK